MPESEKEKHTLEQCNACAMIHKNTQQKFPMKPHHAGPASLDETYAESGISSKDEAAVARHVLDIVNINHSKKFGKTLTESIIQLCPEEKIGKKITPIERKKQKRDLLKKVRDRENQALETSTMRAVYSNNESLSAYDRKRKAMSFDKPNLQPKARKHTPNFESVSWDKDQVLTDVTNLVQSPRQCKAKWSEIARRNAVPGKNGGQVVKEFARDNGVDVFKLDGRSEGIRKRSSKRKMPGGEISVPCPPSTSKLKEQRNSLIASGELLLGDPCSAFTVTRTIVDNGSVKQVDVEVSGRKIPLLSLRQKVLECHEEFMRLSSDEQLQKKTRIELLSELHKKPDSNSDLSNEVLCNKVKSVQRTRNLLFWHDHARILGAGYILVTVSIVYDPFVFLSDDEYKRKTGKHISNLQELIEQPQMYLLALGSSSVFDQLATIAERVYCLRELSETVTTSTGIAITDQARFFSGDKPAQSFERGTQQGGNYKCGSCGVKSCMIEDQAHTLRCTWRSLTDLQSLVLTGKHGNKPGLAKPLDNLKVAEVREELLARGVLNVTEKADVLRQKLADILKGAQRVPTLLIHNPTQNLASLNLERYRILDCEPLHSLKGHLLNLFSELPNILSGKMKDDFTRILSSHLKKR